MLLRNYLINTKGVSNKSFPDFIDNHIHSNNIDETPQQFIQ